MAKSMQEIAGLLRGMRFRRKLFGVDEADVWRQLETLQREYQAAFDAQAAANAALLKEREEVIARLMAQRNRAAPHPAPAAPAAPPATPGPANRAPHRTHAPPRGGDAGG